MPIIDKPFPKYANPPVVEVALGVQFQELSGLRIVEVVTLWQEYRERYPKVEEHPRLDAAVEKFDQPQADVELQTVAGGKLPLPRVWFLSNDETRLIQVQSDRFVFNWRARQQEGTYPSYTVIRKEFGEELDRFIKFVEGAGLGKLRPTQCEVSYFNHIRPSTVWSKHGDIPRVLSVFSSEHTDDFLPEPETAKFASKYVMRDRTGNRTGRLTVTLEPAVLKQDSSPIFSLTLMARGDPNGDDVDSIFRFLDLGHEWVVRGFTSLTTLGAQETWGRQQ